MENKHRPSDMPKTANANFNSTDRSFEQKSEGLQEQRESDKNNDKPIDIDIIGTGSNPEESDLIAVPDKK